MAAALPRSTSGANRYFLDYRECAPGSATANMYLDAAGNVIPDASTIGAGAAGVPGTVAGLWELHHRFGKLPWRTDLAPAIRYAHDGFAVDRKLAAMRDRRAAELHGRTNFMAYYGTLKAGRIFKQPELEATLRRIAAAGPAGFYAGRTADLIVAEMVRDHGHVSAGGPRRVPPGVARAAHRHLGRLPGHHRAPAKLRRHCAACP